MFSLIQRPIALPRTAVCSVNSIFATAVCGVNSIFAAAVCSVNTATLANPTLHQPPSIRGGPLSPLGGHASSPSEGSMPPGSKKKAAPAAPAAKRSASDARMEFAAERLTGKRAQNKQGFTYEVKWKNGPGGKVYPNSFEPPTCLVGWEAEMKKADAAILLQRKDTFLKPVKEKRAREEEAARQKAVELGQRREALMRKQRRLQRGRRRAPEGEEAADEDDEEEEEEEDDDDDDEDVPSDNEQLQAELEKIALELGIAPGTCGATTEGTPEGAATSAGASTSAAPERKRKGTSRVWLAFDRDTNRCTLPHPTDKSKVCDAAPKKGTGTSGHLVHLQIEHPEEWLHIKKTGQRKTSVQMIEDSLKAKVDES
jgi:hypothetical protein